MRSLISADGTCLDHDALDAAVAGAIAALLELGVKDGDVVCLWGPNEPAWVVVALASWSLGATVLPLPPRWTDAEVMAVLSRVPAVVVVGPAELVDRMGRLGQRCEPFATFYPQRGQQRDCVRMTGHRMAAMVPTSGTTGTPKLACLTGAGLMATAMATIDALGLGPGDVYWLPIPLHHVGGLGALVRTVFSDATLYLAPQATLADLAERGVTHASLVPTQIMDLAATGDWPASLRAVMVGGAAPPPDLLARCPAARATYGLTEAGGTVTLSVPGDLPGSSGWALPGYELAVVDDAGKALLADEVGAILVRGPGIMSGYLDTPSPVVDGWLRTGDLGTLDITGRLRVLARRDDMIVSGGENVYPLEVEAALLSHPSIAEAAVVGAPDERWGHAVMAYLVPAPGAEELPADALRAHLDDRLARFKHPRRVAWLPSLPRLASGKVDRRSLWDRV